MTDHPLITRCVDEILECFAEIERLSDSMPEHPSGNRARTGIVCGPEHRWGRRLSEVENCATEWARELLKLRGYQAFGPSERPYASGREPDIVVEFPGFGWWIEAKPIWGDWISDGSSGNRVRNAPSGAHNIRQLVRDARKLERERPVAGDWWGLLGIVFDWDGRLIPDVIEAIGPEWQHRHCRVPDLCCGDDERFGCSPILFWRMAVPRTSLDMGRSRPKTST